MSSDPTSAAEPVLDLNQSPGVRDDPRLVPQASGSSDRLAIALTGSRLLVGRSASAHVRLADRGVGEAHALLERTGGEVYLSDLGSPAGTTLNGQPVDRRLPLRHGDLLGFGPVFLRFENAGSLGPRTAFTASSQSGQHLNNVGGDQHNHFEQAAHESFLRELAATRSRANWCTLAGFVLAILGFAAWVAVIFNDFKENLSWFDKSQRSIQDQFNPSFPPTSGPPTLTMPSIPSLPSPLGPEIAGVPVGAIALTVFFAGTVLIVVGIVLHIVVVARRRQFDRTHVPLRRPA
jgi:hypothetical protein